MILDEIAEKTRVRVKEQKEKVSLEDLRMDFIMKVEVISLMKN